MRRYRKHAIPARAHPLVRRLFEEMNDQHIGMLDMAERSGVNVNTINDWKRRCMPSVANLEACYNVLGLTLTPRPHSKMAAVPTTDLPPTLSVNPTEMESAGT